MVRSHHNNKKTDIKNFALQKIRFDKQQLLENDRNDYKMSSTFKLTKE